MSELQKFSKGYLEKFHEPRLISGYSGKVCTDACFMMLEEIPSEDYRVSIKGYNEVLNLDDIENENDFYVDYTNNYIYFHKSKMGQTITVDDYYGIGLNFIGASRIIVRSNVSEDVIQTLEDLIEQAKLCLEAITTLGGATEVIEQLKEDTETGRKVDKQLKETIKSGEATVQAIKDTGNKSFIVNIADWVSTTNGYKYTLTHNLQSIDLHVSMIDLTDNMAYPSQYKIINVNTIEVYAMEKIKANVVISARYYNGLGENIGDNIVQEVVDARVGMTSLGDKIRDMDSQLVTKVEEINDTITEEVNNINSSLEEKASKTDVQAANARIDTFTNLSSGSTTGDAELADGRSVNGKTYTNIGGAIRALSSGDALGINVINTKHLDADLQGLCDYIDLGLTLQQGYIEVGSNTITENAGYQTLRCPCKEGEKYSVDGYVVGTTKALVNFYNANGSYLNRLEKVDGATYKNYKFTVPSGVASFSVTSRSTGTGGFSPVIRKLKAYSVEKQKAYVTASIKNIYPNLYTVYAKRYTYNSETYIKVMFHYTNDLDMIILFKNCGQSSLLQLYNIYTCSREGTFGDFTKTATTIKTSYSDWVGPFKILATNNIDGDSLDTVTFTGGWYGYNGERTGSKTATLESINAYIDGRNLANDSTLGGYEFKLIVKNLIQASNTKKSDGTGRNVLRETITYIIKGDGKIEVSNKIEALEDITIKEYYGIQVDNAGKYIDSIIYLNDISKKVDFTSYNSYGIKNNPCRRYIGVGGTDYVTAYVEDEGLGKFNYVATNQATAWNSNYKKSYFNLVRGIDLVLTKGQGTYWKGGYIFSSGEMGI